MWELNECLVTAVDRLVLVVAVCHSNWESIGKITFLKIISWYW